MVRLVCAMFCAWIAMSTAVPPMPPDGWCMRTRACAMTFRLPGVPALSRNCPALAASPIASVATSFGISRMVSYMASAALIDPPGELMYSAMSRRGSSADSSRSCAQTRFATASSTSCPSTTMRWCSSRAARSSSNARAGGAVAVLGTGTSWGVGSRHARTARARRTPGSARSRSARSRSGDRPERPGIGATVHRTITAFWQSAINGAAQMRQALVLTGVHPARTSHRKCLRCPNAARSPTPPPAPLVALSSPSELPRSPAGRNRPSRFTRALHAAGAGT